MKHKIRILYYIPGGSFSIGGANSQLYVLLKNINKDLFDVEIIGNENLVRLQQIPGIKYTNLKKDNVIEIYKHMKAQYKSCENQKNIMHVLSMRGLLVGVLIKLLRSKTEIKLVYTENLWTPDLHLRSRVREVIHKTILRIATEFVDKVICVSNSVKEFFLQIGVGKDKLQVIYNGIEITSSSPKSTGQNVCRFVTVGSINWVKDHKLMLEVIKYLQENLPFVVEFIIIGTGDLKSEIEKYSREIAINNLRFLGWLDYSSLQNEVSKSAFYIQLSLSESFGVAVLEGMSLGVVPIVSNRGGLVELVNEKTGFICDLDKDFKQELKTYVQKVFPNPQLYNEISRRVIKKSKQFKVSCMVENYSQLYLSI